MNDQKCEGKTHIWGRIKAKQKWGKKWIKLHVNCKVPVYQSKRMSPRVIYFLPPWVYFLCFCFFYFFFYDEKLVVQHVQAWLPKLKLNAFFLFISFANQAQNYFYGLFYGISIKKKKKTCHGLLQYLRHSWTANFFCQKIGINKWDFLVFFLIV